MSRSLQKVKTDVNPDGASHSAPSGKDQSSLGSDAEPGVGGNGKEGKTR